MTTTEEWLPVVGYEGLYSVSSEGDVRSLDRTLSDGRRWRGRLLRPNTLNYGHKVVNLCRDGQVAPMLVHRLVMLAFVGPGRPDQEVRHLDGNPANNRLDNLAWGTHAENMADQRLHGTNSSSRKTHCPRNHPLTPPNLEAWTASRGGRKCLACSRARAQVQREGGGNMQQLGDAHYERIAGEGVAV